MMQLLLEHQFLMSANGTQPEAARAFLTADQMIFGGAHQDVIRRIFTYHGLLADAEPVVGVGDRKSQVKHVLTTGSIDNFTDMTVSFTEEGAEAIVLHFDSINMEVDTGCTNMQCDALYFYDAEGRLYGRVGGEQEDFYGPVVRGDTVILRWVTDGSTESAGFSLDRIETYELGDDEPGGGGCSCRVAGGGRPAWAAALLLLAPLALMRRRRRRAP